MMVTVHANKVPIAPRKLRAVLRTLRGRTIPQALALLAASPRTTTVPIEKLFKASVSAVRDRQPAARAEQVRIVELYANESARLYRTRIRAKGRASSYAKRSSHLTVMVQIPESQRSKVTSQKSSPTQQARSTAQAVTKKQAPTSQ